MEGLGALSCYMANPPVVARWNRSGNQEGMRDASECDLREVVTSGFACRSTKSAVLSGWPDYESGALLSCRSNPDAACDGEQGIGPSFRLSGNQ